jgi:hypothetical protein
MNVGFQDEKRIECLFHIYEKYLILSKREEEEEKKRKKRHVM